MNSLKNKSVWVIVFFLLFGFIIGISVFKNKQIRDNYTIPWDNQNFKPLKVLIVTSEIESGYAQGIKNLLDQCRIDSTIAKWTLATIEYANNFDLIIVTEHGRGRDRDDEVLNYEKPVLGYGSFGCSYFGWMNLKNGQPYT